MEAAQARRGRARGRIGEGDGGEAGNKGRRTRGWSKGGRFGRKSGKRRGNRRRRRIGRAPPSVLPVLSSSQKFQLFLHPPHSLLPLPLEPSLCLVQGCLDARLLLLQSPYLFCPSIQLSRHFFHAYFQGFLLLSVLSQRLPQSLQFSVFPCPDLATSHALALPSSPPIPNLSHLD